MFSLILTVISIAIVTIIALACLFYGADVWHTGKTKAGATQLAVETEQIQGAIQLFQNSNSRLPLSLDELTNGGEYLTSVPNGAWGSNLAFIQTSSPTVQEDVCLLYNQQRGIPLVPSCTDEFYKSVVVCCSQAPDPNAVAQ